MMAIAAALRLVTRFLAWTAAGPGAELARKACKNPFLKFRHHMEVDGF